MNKRNLSLKLEEWPTGDRRALEAAFNPGNDLFDDAGLAVKWRPGTRNKVIKSYGAFLHCLGRHGALDVGAMPAVRITRNNIKLFVGDARSRNVASETLASLVRDLREAIRVMCPGAPREDLILASRTLDRIATPSRDQRDQIVAPSTLFYTGIKRMKHFKAAAASNPIAGVKFGDGLMMSMEAIKSLRLRNLSSMLVEQNIVENQLDEYELRYEPHETKTRAKIRARLPKELKPWIKYWIDIVRPNLLRVAGRESCAMWITSWGTDMAPITLYYRFCNATEEETKKRINPHLCRKIIVTGIAVGAPDMIELAPGALDHTSRRHTKEAYDLADDLAASRVVTDMMSRRRAIAVRRSRR